MNNVRKMERERNMRENIKKGRGEKVKGGKKEEDRKRRIEKGEG